MKLPSSVNVLLLGSGGREHALAWKIAQSGRTGKLYIAPGNAGTALCGTNVDLSLSNFGGIKQLILANNINLVVVGPESPLVKGVYDYLMEDSDMHIPVIGPSMAGARLEGSKDFAKSFMSRHKIPTARYKSFSKETLTDGFLFLEQLEAPYVLKADGLAAGKGVVIINSLNEAKSELEKMMDGKFGAAGNMVVIEEYLDGVECSVFVATDGKNYKILPVAKDYKRIGEGNTGLNTGGMGAVSPVPFADAAFMEQVKCTIIEPTINGLSQEIITYRGFIFIGIMNVGGKPYVIEYNVRLGDPETQAVLPLIESDIIELFEGIAFESLDTYEMKISPKTSVTVVCAAEGYPDDYKTGDEITGLDDSTWRDTFVFQAGTMNKTGKTYTNGGRVLAVTSLDNNIDKAREKNYKIISGINYKGKYCRMDIGCDLIDKENC